MNGTVSLDYLLTPEDRETLDRMREMLVDVLVTPGGVAVLLVGGTDTAVATMVLAGDECAAPGLLVVAGSLGAQLYGRPEEATLQ